MMQEVGEFVFRVWLGVGAVLLLLLVTSVLVGVLLPKRVSQEVFSDRHFTPSELALMGSFPLGIARSAVLMGLVVLPDKGRSREIQSLKNLPPRWFWVASWVVLPALVTCAALFVLLLSIMAASAAIFR